jgi:hypothetical protein
MSEPSDVASRGWLRVFLLGGNSLWRSGQKVIGGVGPLALSVLIACAPRPAGESLGPQAQANAPSPTPTPVDISLTRDVEIPIDHVGPYEWYTPATDAISMSDLEGSALEYRVGVRGVPESASGGVRMRVTFNVVSFSGEPRILILNAHVGYGAPNGEGN